MGESLHKCSSEILVYMFASFILHCSMFKVLTISNVVNSPVDVFLLVSEKGSTRTYSSDWGTHSGLSRCFRMELFQVQLIGVWFPNLSVPMNICFIWTIILTGVDKILVRTISMIVTGFKYK